MLYKVSLSISLLGAFSASALYTESAANVQPVIAHNEVAPCTNGFDDVDVCKLIS